jgi:hypothetical protein
LEILQVSRSWLLRCRSGYLVEVLYGVSMWHVDAETVFLYMQYVGSSSMYAVACQMDLHDLIL